MITPVFSSNCTDLQFSADSRVTQYPITIGCCIEGNLFCIESNNIIVSYKIYGNNLLCWILVLS